MRIDSSALRTLHRPQITAMFLGSIRQLGPGRIVVGHANLPHLCKVSDLRIEMRRLQRTRLDIVLSPSGNADNR